MGDWWYQNKTNFSQHTGVCFLYPSTDALQNQFYFSILLPFAILFLYWSEVFSNIELLSFDCQIEFKQHKMLSTQDQGAWLSPTSHHADLDHEKTRERWLQLESALVQDTDYMVEKTYHLAPYLGPIGAYLKSQWPIQGSKCPLELGGQNTLSSIKLLEPR